MGDTLRKDTLEPTAWLEAAPLPAATHADWVKNVKSALAILVKDQRITLRWLTRCHADLKTCTIALVRPSESVADVG